MRCAHALTFVRRYRHGVLLTAETGGTTTFSSYDAFGRVAETRRVIGNSSPLPVQSFDYTPCGDLLATHTYTNETDAITESYAYDTQGNRTATTNALGDVVLRICDPFGRVVSEDGAAYPVRYAYDTEGRRTSLSTTRDGTTWDTTTWAYDAATGNCLSKTYADGSTVTYSYTSDSLPLRTTYPSGAWKENVYDEKRQVVGVVSSDGAQDVSMQRDVFGRVTSVSNFVALAECSLDDFWGATNEVQTVDGVAVSLKREFDAYGRIVRFVRIGGEESMFDYAPHGAISVVSNDSVAIGYAFTSDVLDAGYALVVQGGADFSREVFRHGCLRSCVVAVSNHCDNVSHGLEYSYDALQRPVSRNADSFGYNARGEVASATIGGRNESHSYDDIGNAVQTAYPASTFDYTSNCRNQYSSIAEVAGGTQLATSVSYDLNGNMTRHGEWTYAYDSGNRLVSVASNGITIASLYYDAQGRRVKKVAADGAHRYFYDGWLLVYEYITRPDNTISEIEYVWGKDVSGARDGAAGIGGLLYQKRDGLIYVPYYDAYGSVLGYRDSQGNLVASYTYDAFGNVIGQSGLLANTFSFRFSTKYFDIDCGLYYYGCRHYKPQIICWLTEDPIGENGGLNLYAFCENATIFSTDALGETKYWDNYLNNSAYPDSPDVWEKVGGRLFWSFLTNGNYWNSCAIRVSRSLILSGHAISAKTGREKNFDIKATKDAERAGKSAKKGEMLKAESPNARFVINARNVGALLDELLTDPSIKKDSWSTVEEALKKAECIRKEDGEAFFADDGHAGMIKRGYVDHYFPQKAKGRIWRIK